MTKIIALASIINDPAMAGVDAENRGLVVGGLSGVGLYAGAGAPSFAAPKGSLYLATDGSSSSTRLYSCSVASGTWVAVTTAS